MRRKQKPKKQHIQLLQSLKSTMAPIKKATTVVFYTDGSQGQPQSHKGLTNSTAVCRLSANNTPILAKYWNLGPSIEVADAEVIGVVKGLELANSTPCNNSTTFYFFVDSQAAIQQLQGHTFHALKA